MRFACILTIVVALSGAGCASLGGLSSIIQPPRFEQADGQPAQLRILGPSRTMPLGGAGVRIWLKVTNPNGFGFTLSTVNAALMLEGSRAADADFPIGLPLSARQESVIPLDLAISFSDLPGLAGSLRRLAVGGSVPYELEGTVGVDAGRLGTPTFGPMLLARGEMRVVDRGSGIGDRGSGISLSEPGSRAGSAGCSEVRAASLRDGLPSRGRNWPSLRARARSHRRCTRAS